MAVLIFLLEREVPLCEYPCQQGQCHIADSPGTTDSDIFIRKNNYLTIRKEEKNPKSRYKFLFQEYLLISRIFFQENFLLN
jgi:hypothetical protein